MTKTNDLPTTPRVLRAKLALTQEQLADRLGVSFATVMRHKWGSCSSAGTVTLASGLLDQDARFQDYVIVHELLHLRYATHGRVFKALMSAHVPGWRALEARRTHGDGVKGWSTGKRG